MLLSSMLFIQSEERYIDKPNPHGKLHLVHEHRYGKPFVYYLKREKLDAKIYYDSVAYNLLIAYSVTLLLQVLVLLAFRVIKAPSLKHKSVALLILVSIISLPYLIVYIFGQTLLNNSVIARNFWQVKALTYLKISPNRLSFDDMDFPLKEAAHNKDLKMIRLLLARSADINMANKLGETALHIAVRENAIYIVQELLKNGANVNARNSVGDAPLHYVDHIKIAKLLLLSKANPNKMNNKKQTPIFLVGNPQAKALILRQGGNVNAVDLNGNSALHFVRKPEEAAVLIAAGAKVNKKNKLGKTVLHEIVPQDKVTVFLWAPKLARELIRRGANVDILDKQGMSALHYSIQNCNPRSKFISTLETGRLLFKASRSARAQYKAKKYSATLATLINADKDKCWRRISRK